MMRTSSYAATSKRALRGALVALATVATMLAGVALPATQTMAATQSTNTVQQAEAIVKPSVVFVVIKWHGYLMNGPLSSLLSPNGRSAPGFTATTTCSGFVASPDGDIVTAGHCVDDQSVQYGGRGVIIQSALAEAIDQGYLTDSQARALLPSAYRNWKVEGTEANSPPDRTVGVYPTKAASTITVSQPIAANVVDFKPFTRGDVALLKVHTTTPMPSLLVASTEPGTGTQIVAAGFPGAVSQTVDPTTQPSLKDGTISGEQTVAGVPFTEISAATSSGMSGGPVVDLQGRVVGTVSWSPGAATQSFNFITATSSVNDLLASHKVSTQLSATDQAYRDGLTLYFAGKYHAAVKKFDQVLALEPDHAQAQEYKRLSIANYPNEKSSGTSTMVWLGIGLGVLLLVGAGVLLFFLLRRRRAPRPEAGVPITGVPAPPAAEQPAPSEPMPAGATATAAAPTEPAPTEIVLEPESATAGAVAPPERHAFCPNCGEPHVPDAHFCEACGQRLPVVTGPSS